MTRLHEDLKGCHSQYFSVVIRERCVPSFYKIMVESSVGVFWGAYGHLGELQVVYWIGGDSGGDGFFLPFHVGFPDQNSSPSETKTDNTQPEDLC